MREFKFRAWDKDDKKMYKVVSINNSIFGECEQSYIRACELDHDETLEGTKIFKLYNFELIQYIGLKDINNKEIYEGDIVKVFDVATGIESIGYVVYGSGSFYITDECYSRYRWIDYQIEAIGNIYEDEELLV